MIKRVPPPWLQRPTDPDASQPAVPAKSGTPRSSLLEQTLRGEPLRLRRNNVRRLFDIGHDMQQRIDDVGRMLLARIPADAPVSDADMAWCTNTLEPMVQQLCMMFVTVRGALASAVVIGASSQEASALCAIVGHDLPYGRLSALRGAVAYIQDDRLLPLDACRLLSLDSKRRTLYATGKAALAEATAELLRYGCGIDPACILHYDRSLVGGAYGLRLTDQAHRTVIDALKNFLTNGARRRREALAPGERSVQLHWRQLPGGALQVDIEDNGIGVPPERIADLGRRGVMLKEVPAQGESGTGLFSIIHRGWLPLFLRVMYDADGRRVGSVFRYYVPHAVVVGRTPAGQTTWADLLIANRSDGFVLLPQSAHKAPVDPDTPI